ncbi:type II CAAX endopeptidase family protein [uncultured Psychroserpens sp.]|uniref:CPBP family intramembrane glutamic endopeptidase n=1 Tax=uncultured Psychroserpens sp. TaxID=255436 RepID=UPI002617B47F|nr:type II CAAX endopeptidase family protein [uncultured Psychroserpens sp.]
MRILKYVLATLLFLVFLEAKSYVILEIFFSVLDESFYKFYLLTASVIETLCILLLLYLVNKKSLFTSFKISYRYLLIGLALGASYVFVQQPLNKVYNVIFNDDKAIVFDFISADISIWKALAIVVFIPLAEELFFRGYIQNGLNKHIKPLFAVILSSFLFAIIHFPFIGLFYPDSEFFILDFHLTYIACFGGLISALLYHKSKSFIPSIVFHMSWNLGVILV